LKKLRLFLSFASFALIFFITDLSKGYIIYPIVNPEVFDRIDWYKSTEAPILNPIYQIAVLKYIVNSKMLVGNRVDEADFLLGVNRLTGKDRSRAFIDLWSDNHRFYKFNTYGINLLTRNSIVTEVEFVGLGLWI